MATGTTPVFNDIKGAQRAQWTSESGTSEAAFMGFYEHATVQRLGGTGTVTVEGSMDGTNWIGATTDGSTAISLATATNAAANIYEHFPLLRIKVASGTASVVILSK